MSATSETTPAPTTECPACEGHGETSRSATRNEFGVWERDDTRCTICQATGVVTADIADEYHHHIDQQED